MSTTFPLHTADLLDLSAFGVAHFTDDTAATGCTVIVAPSGATCGVDVRGGAPATRETDLLQPEKTVEQVHAVVLSGGSAFGLEASCGVAVALSERNIGFKLMGACVPIVVQACLFDLVVGENAWPDKAAGYQATCDALCTEGSSQALEMGNVGAGCGASVGKLLGAENAMKGGFGISGARLGDLVVVALVAVNAAGNIRNREGAWIAGCRNIQGDIVEPLATLANRIPTAFDVQNSDTPCTNTTIGCILTNAHLAKAQATRVATMTHDAYARAIYPVHTTGDGDVVFCFASGEVEAPIDVVGMLAAEAMQDAIIAGVMHAKSAYGLVAARDL